MEKSWIPWVRVGFTDEELKFMKENPIKSSCGVCHKDTTGKTKETSNCTNQHCPFDYW
jgi:hypothetical protein